MGAYYQLLGAWLLITYIFGFGQRKSILHRIFLKCLSCFEADDACDFLDVWADETRFARVGVSGPTCDLWRGQLAPSGSRTFSSSPFCCSHYHCFSILKVVSIAVVAIYTERTAGTIWVSGFFIVTISPVIIVIYRKES